MTTANNLLNALNMELEDLYQRQHDYEEAAKSSWKEQNKAYSAAYWADADKKPKAEVDELYAQAEALGAIDYENWARIEKWEKARELINQLVEIYSENWKAE